MYASNALLEIKMEVLHHCKLKLTKRRLTIGLNGHNYDNVFLKSQEKRMVVENNKCDNCYWELRS